MASQIILIRNLGRDNIELTLLVRVHSHLFLDIPAIYQYGSQ